MELEGLLPYSQEPPFAAVLSQISPVVLSSYVEICF